jgi:hypothetical protein
MGSRSPGRLIPGRVHETSPGVERSNARARPRCTSSGNSPYNRIGASCPEATRPRRVGPSGADRSRSLVPPGTGPPEDAEATATTPRAVTVGRRPWPYLPTARPPRSTDSPPQPGQQRSRSWQTRSRYRHSRRARSRRHSKRRSSSSLHHRSRPLSCGLSISRRRHRP